MYNMYNQFYRSPYVQPQQPMQYQPQSTYQPQTMGIQGKTVDSLEVVKAMDIPLDRKCKLFSISRWKCDCHKTITTRWY